MIMVVCSRFVDALSRPQCMVWWRCSGVVGCAMPLPYHFVEKAKILLSQRFYPIGRERKSV